MVYEWTVGRVCGPELLILTFATDLVMPSSLAETFDCRMVALSVLWVMTGHGEHTSFSAQSYLIVL